MKNKRLGEMLVDAGILSEKQIEEAIALQKNSGKRLGTILLENHYINETQLIEVLRIQLGIDFIDLNKTKIDPYMAGAVSKVIAQQYRVVTFRKEKNVILLAMEDPLNFRALETVKQTTKCKVRPYIAYSEAIDRAISVLYENEGASIAIAQIEAEKGSEITVEDLVQKKEQNQSSSAPTVKLANSILERGIAEKASDIHIEPRENDVFVRIRVDGKLNRILTIPKSLQESVISRLKVMSEMNITEHRVPQVLRETSGVGEKSGELVATLKTIGDYYTNETDFAMKSALDKLEPAMLVLLALFVRFIVVAIYLPMFTMYSLM